VGGWSLKVSSSFFSAAAIASSRGPVGADGETFAEGIFESNPIFLLKKKNGTVLVGTKEEPNTATFKVDQNPFLEYI
jgi:hypothetical protein